MKNYTIALLVYIFILSYASNICAQADNINEYESGQQSFYHNLEVFIPESRKADANNKLDILKYTLQPGTLRLCAPPDAIDPSRLEQFFLRYGIEVNVSVYRSNNELKNMIEPVNGSLLYDVLILPGEKMSYLAEDDLLMVLHDNDFRDLGTVLSRFLFFGYHNAQRYGMPVSWRVYGLLVNKSMVSDKYARTVSLKDLFDPLENHHSVMLPDDPRMSLGMALSALGYSYNSVNRDQLEQASSLVAKVMESPLFIGLVEMEKGAKMCSENLLSMAMSSSQAARLAMKKNNHLTFVTPRAWVPAEVFFAAVSSKTKMPQASLLLLDFFLDPEVAARNAMYGGLASTNGRAIDLLADFRTEYFNSLCPKKIATTVNLEFILDEGNADMVFKNSWQDMLSSSSFWSY